MQRSVYVMRLMLVSALGFRVPKICASYFRVRATQTLFEGVPALRFPHCFGSLTGILSISSKILLEMFVCCNTTLGYFYRVA